MRWISGVLAAIVLICGPAGAQEANIVTRMMSHPVTVFDWGMAQLDRDITRTARRVFPEASRQGQVKAGTIYSWRRQRITLFVSNTVPTSQRTAAECRRIFEQVGTDLTSGLPIGSDSADYYLESVFKPVGNRWAGRFENIGAKLGELVRLEILLLPSSFAAVSGDTKRISCEGRIGATADGVAFKAGS